MKLSKLSNFDLSTTNISKQPIGAIRQIAARPEMDTAAEIAEAAGNFRRTI